MYNLQQMKKKEKHREAKFQFLTKARMTMAAFIALMMEAARVSKTSLNFLPDYTAQQRKRQSSFCKKTVIVSSPQIFRCKVARISKTYQRT
jgi:hypothetical protein